MSSTSNTAQFWSDLFGLDMNRDYLWGKLASYTRDDCLGRLKPVLNLFFSGTVKTAIDCQYADARKATALNTLQVILSAVLAKNLAGWEVMEVFTGGVHGNDSVLTNLASLLETVMKDTEAPSELRHSALQVSITYMAGIQQLSIGAYFLRRNMFSAISSLMISAGTEKFTFEALILLALLSNFHKSDAAKLNPYLQQIKDAKSKRLMRKVCWASSFAADTAVKAYQAVQDDSPPTLLSNFGTFVALLRPDRAIGLTTTESPRELFKNQPIEAAVILLPIFDFVYYNPSFPSILAEDLVIERTEKDARPVLPLSITIVSLSSYLVTHASSTGIPKAMAYAGLALSNILAWVENQVMLDALLQPSKLNIRLCRQRTPVLPIVALPRPPLCAVLDCCVLWLRHNLHLRFEAQLHCTCIRICVRVIWSLQQDKTRLQYHWAELWQAVEGLLSFLVGKLDTLYSTGGVELLVNEVACLLNMVLTGLDAILPSPTAVHEFLYELARSLPTLKKQEALLQVLAGSARAPSSLPTSRPLANIIAVAEYYEARIASAGAKTALSAMKVVAKDVEKDGVRAAPNPQEVEEPQKYSEDVVSFVRFACQDALSLMP